jgi:hypothetical protein
MLAGAADEHSCLRTSNKPKRENAMNRLLSLVVLALCVSSGMVWAGGSPPVDIGFSRDFQATAGCNFPVNWTGTGKSSIITLPGDRVIVTGPKQTTVVTNLDDPSKSVALQVGGVIHASFGPQGEVFIVALGRNLIADPAANIMVLAIGTFKYILDPITGEPVLTDLSGEGQLFDVCVMID